VVLIFVTLLLVGCSGGNDTSSSPASNTTQPTSKVSEGPGAFVLRVSDYHRDGQFGRLWYELHPAQQRLITPEGLASCLPVDEKLVDPAIKLRVKEVYNEPWRVPGTKLPAQPAKAVTVEAVSSAYLESGDRVESVVETWTQHAFRVNGQWSWITSADLIRQARDDAC
jgi:hypothetical protein